MKDNEVTALVAPHPAEAFPDLGLKILGHCILCGGPCYGEGSQIHTEACAQFREQFEALRALQLVECTLWGGEGCSVCGRAWFKDRPECHRAGCVAAPFTKKEVMP
jgi:hypothetical protein